MGGTCGKNADMPAESGDRPGDAPASGGGSGGGESSNLPPTPAPKPEAAEGQAAEAAGAKSEEATAEKPAIESPPSEAPADQEAVAMKDAPGGAEEALREAEETHKADVADEPAAVTAADTAEAATVAGAAGGATSAAPAAADPSKDEMEMPEEKGDEAVAAEPELVEGEELSEEQKAKAEAAFQRCDTDEDGKVTVEELSALFNEAGKETTPEEREMFMKRFDLNDKSYLDVNDFLTMMKFQAKPAAEADAPSERTHTGVGALVSYLFGSSKPAEAAKDDKAATKEAGEEGPVYEGPQLDDSAKPEESAQTAPDVAEEPKVEPTPAQEAELEHEPGDAPTPVAVPEAEEVAAEETPAESPADADAPAADEPAADVPTSAAVADAAPAEEGQKAEGNAHGRSTSLTPSFLMSVMGKDKPSEDAKPEAEGTPETAAAEAAAQEGVETGTAGDVGAAGDAEAASEEPKATETDANNTTVEGPVMPGAEETGDPTEPTKKPGFVRRMLSTFSGERSSTGSQEQDESKTAEEQVTQ